MNNYTPLNIDKTQKPDGKKIPQLNIWLILVVIFTLVVFSFAIFALVQRYRANVQDALIYSS